MRNNLNLPISLLADGNRITQITHTVIDLNLIVEELFECSDVEDLV